MLAQFVKNPRPESYAMFDFKKVFFVLPATRTNFTDRVWATDGPLAGHLLPSALRENSNLDIHEYALCPDIGVQSWEQFYNIINLAQPSSRPNFLKGVQKVSYIPILQEKAPPVPTGVTAVGHLVTADAVVL